MHAYDDNFRNGMSFENLSINKDELIHRTICQSRVFCLEVYLDQYPMKVTNQQYGYERPR